MEKTKVLLGMRTMGDIPTDMVRFLLFLEIPDDVELSYWFTQSLPHCIWVNDIIRMWVHNEYDYIFFLDDDNIPENKDIFKKLLAMDKKIATGIVPSRTPMQWFHTLCIFKEQLDENSMIGYDQYINLPEEETFEVAMCGFGCVLIHKDVFTKVYSTFHDFPTEMRTMRYYPLEDRVYSEEEIDYRNIKLPEWALRYKKYVSEDICFFERCKRLCDEKIRANKEIRCTHIGLPKLVRIKEDIEEANKDLPLTVAKWVESQ